MIRAAPQTFYTTAHPSPIGTLNLARDGGGNLVGLWLDSQKHHIGNTSAITGTVNRPRRTGMPDSPLFTLVKNWLDRYFAGERPGISELPLAPAGGDFRRRVWDILRQIPYGETVTYGEIAAKLKTSARAVGGAVGHNPISVIIPCHRVVGANGNLTGFDGGIPVKIKLLEHEGVGMSEFFTPKI